MGSQNGGQKRISKQDKRSSRGSKQAEEGRVRTHGGRLLGRRSGAAVGRAGAATGACRACWLLRCRHGHNAGVDDVLGGAAQRARVARHRGLQLVKHHVCSGAGGTGEAAGRGRGSGQAEEGLVGRGRGAAAAETRLAVPRAAVCGGGGVTCLGKAGGRATCLHPAAHTTLGLSA